MAATSTLMSPRLSIAFFKRPTTSSPSTPEHLNPLVQEINSPTAKPEIEKSKKLLNTTKIGLI